MSSCSLLTRHSLNPNRQSLYALIRLAFLRRSHLHLAVPSRSLHLCLDTTMDPPRKRVKVTFSDDKQTAPAAQAPKLDSLSRQITPPRRNKHSSHFALEKASELPVETKLDVPLMTSSQSGAIAPESIRVAPSANSVKTLPSPVQLMRIRDLQASENIDAVSLHDILGDPLIKEVWIFNFCVSFATLIHGHDFYRFYRTPYSHISARLFYGFT